MGNYWAAFGGGNGEVQPGEIRLDFVRPTEV